ncbi:hypothetical protein J3A83DRAFT_4184650 [Scleroderma citrinum]
MPFKVTPSMIMDAVYPWQEIFQDDLWMNILEHIAMSPTGWQDVQVAWQNVKSSGVIDLTGWKDNDDSTKAGPLKLLQDSDSSTDTKSLNITQEAEDKEESTDTDTGSDTPIVGPLKVSEVLPAGWTTFASHINNICCHYEGGYTRHAGLNVSLGSLYCYSLILPMSSLDANLCVYKLDIMTEGAASYIWHALQLKSFKVTPGYNHSLYIKAMSPKAIKTSLPPSHCSIMLEVVELPHPDDLAFHVLAGINPSLICWTIAMFLAQLWQEGELVNTSGRIISVYLQNQSAVINIDSDEGLVVHEDWVKIFAGPDRGIEGCIVNYVTANFKKTLSLVHAKGQLPPFLEYHAHGDGQHLFDQLGGAADRVDIPFLLKLLTVIVDSHQKKPLNKPKVVMALNIKMVTSLTQCEETLP